MANALKTIREMRRLKEKRFPQGVSVKSFSRRQILGQTFPCGDRRQGRQRHGARQEGVHREEEGGARWGPSLEHLKWGTSRSGWHSGRRGADGA